MADIRPKRRRIIVPGISEPAAGLSSNCFVVGDLVTINGLTARDANGAPAAPGDAYRQAVVVFDRMNAYLKAAGGTMDDIIKLNCYLTDIRHRESFVKARAEFFSGDFPPCVVLGGVVFTSPGLLIEVDALAILGSAPE